MSLLLSIYLTGPSVAFGQISLDEAVNTALENHSQLKIAKTDIAIAQAQLIDAGKMENPVFEFAVQSQTADGPDREGSVFMGYSQIFPVTDKLRRQRDLGISRVRLACAEVRDVERRFIAQVLQHYIDAVGAKELANEFVRLENETNRSIDLAKKQLANALGSELEVASAETEKLLVQQMRRSAEADYEVALAELRPYLNMEPGTPLNPTQRLDSIIAQLKPTIQRSRPSGFERPDIIAAQARITYHQTDKEMARAEAVEDWEISAGYESVRSVDEPIGAERDLFLGIGLKIPLPVRKKGLGRIAEASANAEKAKYQLASTQITASGEIGTRTAEVESADIALISLRNRVLPQLEDREAKTLKGYEQGLLNFSQVIILQQQQSRTREAITKAKLAKATAMARLQEALGSNPKLKVFDSAACQPCIQTVEEPEVTQSIPVKESGNHPRKKRFFRR